MPTPTWVKEALGDVLAPREEIVDTEELEEDKLAVASTQKRGYLVQKRLLRAPKVWPFMLNVPATDNGTPEPQAKPEPEPETAPAPEPQPEEEPATEPEPEPQAPRKVTTTTGPSSNGHQISRLHGIGPERAQRLQEQGIRTVHDLRNADTDTVTETLRVAPSTVQAWKNQADLTTLHGIGPKRAEQLEAQGILTLTDLANADPATLTEELNVSQSTIETWQEEAQDHAAPPEELTRLTGVGETRAQRLIDNGIESLNALVNADPETVAEDLNVGPDTVIDWQKEAIADPTFESDLLDVKGIGRTRARDLIRLGVRSKSTFVDYPPQKLAEGLGVREDTIAGWQRDARQG